MEKVLIKHVRSGLPIFLLEKENFLTGWYSVVVIPVEVDNSQIKASIENKSMLYYLRDSWPTPNIQIKHWKSFVLAYVNCFDIWVPDNFSEKAC